MLLAEDLLLLLTDDTTGKPVVDGTKLDLALAGAVLLDLATAGRLEVSEPGGSMKPGRVAVLSSQPTGDDVLDEGLRRIEAKRPQKPQSVLPALAKRLRQALYERLVRRGILRFEEGRVLGIFPTKQWPASDSAHEDEARRGLYDVLVVGRTPQQREALLVSLLHAVDGVPKVVADGGLGKRELKTRAKAIAEGEFAGAAVRKAIEAVNTAVIASVTAAAAASAAGSS